MQRPFGDAQGSCLGPFLFLNYICFPYIMSSENTMLIYTAMLMKLYIAVQRNYPNGL